MSSVTIKMGHAPIRFIAKPVKADGSTSAVEEGTQTVTSSNPSVLTAEEDADNAQNGTITILSPGESDVTWEGDADLGEGVETITTSIHFIVLEPDATGFSVQFDSGVTIQD